MKKPKIDLSQSQVENSSLSEKALALKKCIAKTRFDARGTSSAGRTVEDHCKIVGQVARCMLNRMPIIQQSLFPKHAYIPALIHDIGKICPTFQEKLYRAVEGYSKNSLPELHTARPELEREWNGHSTVSHASLPRYKEARQVAEIIGQHHGFPTQYMPANSPIFGGTAWQEGREELLTKLLKTNNLDDPNIWPTITSPEQSRLVAGLTIVADWIGSGERFQCPNDDWSPLIEDAVTAAGFLPLNLHHGLSFEDIFTFTPLEPQSRFYTQVTSPGVYILEAPMGTGKTEAALYAAYLMLDKGLSSGIYFGLPTQLTSNRIHTRLENFLSKILKNKGKALLLHGKAWLERYARQEMGEDASPQGSWFQGAKRGLLAPFSAGTVDQALMAAMNIKHSAVRSFGLAGKTVILDEVHSYDAYTGVIIDELISLLRHYNCTVIILSATLTSARRSTFTGHTPQKNSYPLVSVYRTTENTFEEIECPLSSQNISESSPTIVSLKHCSSDGPAIEEALLRAEMGQQVLWIENTVAEAQNCFKLVAARACNMDIEVGLIHSRFTPYDRAKNEAHWTTLYGKNSNRRNDKGRILVGTQVLEQSLDIDSDFMITRFCPTDMLLQRLGRLWRHTNTERPIASKREAWLLHPTLKEVRINPEKAFGKTGYVYAPYVLYRSLELWDGLCSVDLPNRIRPLLESTYADRTETEEKIIDALHKLEKERSTLRGLALRGVSTDGNILPEKKVSTRAGQLPEADVLLLRSFNQTTGQLELSNGTKINLSTSKKINWAEKQEIAAQLTINIVRVPESKAPNALSGSSLKLISPWLYCGNTEETQLRIGLIQLDDQLYDLYGQPTGQKKLQYRCDYGYMVE